MVSQEKFDRRLHIDWTGFSLINVLLSGLFAERRNAELRKSNSAQKTSLVRMTATKKVNDTRTILSFCKTSAAAAATTDSHSASQNTSAKDSALIAHLFRAPQGVADGGAIGR